MPEAATIDERKARAKAFLKKYAASVDKKGSQIVAGFYDELPDEYKSFKRLATGIPSLDRFFGGGLPMGGPITLGGKEGSGKTTLALRLAAAAQRAGQMVLYGAIEGTLDVVWSELQGVNTQDMLVLTSGTPEHENITPTTLEDYLNAVIELINNNIVDFIVLDSLDAMTARGRLKAKAGKRRDLDDADIALKARILSDFYPRIIGACRSKRITLLQIGQLRAKGIGGPFVSEDISSGNARKFYDILTLHMRRGEQANWPKDGSHLLGYEIVLKAKKSKISGITEGSEMRTKFFFNAGFDPVFEMVLEGLEKGFIEKRGAAAASITTLAGTEVKIPYGKDYKIAAWIKENNLIYELRAKITGEDIPEGKSYETLGDPLAA